MIDTQHKHSPENNAADAAFCKHCQLPFDRGDEKEFCCQGCRLAYSLIRSLHLDQFYKIQKNLRIEGQKADNPQDDASQYEVFDQVEFQQGFCRKLQDGDSRLVCELYIDGMSCYACVWLCENAVAKFGHATEFSVSLATGRGQLIFDPERVKLSEIAYRLRSLGYSIAPNRDDVKRQRQGLIRLGIAGFCFMNIMVLALAEYINGSDLSGQFLHLFRWISWALASMSLVGAGQPFYKNSLMALKKRQLHLDLPISIAVLGAYFYSVWQLYVKGSYVYFDSLTAIIFLLSLGRFLQQVAVNKHLRRIAMFQNTQLDYIRRKLSDGSFELIPFRLIKTGDYLQILSRGIVPVEAELLSRRADVNYESMTGEEKWCRLNLGDVIQSGAENGDHPISVKAREDGASSDLQRISHAAKQLTQIKGSYSLWSMRLSRYLTVAVLAIAFLTILYFFNIDPHEGIRRAVSILLVACPCAFGLGVPLILTRGFDLGLGAGVLWNHPRALEQLDDVSLFFFDKTGTLTKPRAAIDSMKLIDSVLMNKALEKNDFYHVLTKLSELSEHHVNQSLAQWGKREFDFDKKLSFNSSVLVAQEVAGKGISLKWAGFHFKIGRYEYCSKSYRTALPCDDSSYVSLDGEICAEFTIGERYLKGTRKILSRLFSEGREISILSGDSQAKLKAFIAWVGIPGISYQSGLSPTDKSDEIRRQLKRHKNPIAAMVGNGINDSTALAQSTLGIVVNGAADLAKKHADLVLVNPGIEGLSRAIDISHRARSAIKLVFSFSLVFNSLGIILGTLGYISPGIAAFLMPISSLSVIYLASRF